MNVAKSINDINYVVLLKDKQLLKVVGAYFNVHAENRNVLWVFALREIAQR